MEGGLIQRNLWIVNLKLLLRLSISSIPGISDYNDVAATINFSTNFFQKDLFVGKSDNPP